MERRWTVKTLQKERERVGERERRWVMGALNEAAGHVDIYFIVRNIILLLPFRQVNMFFFLTLFL